MKKKIRGMSGLLLGLVLGFFLWGGIHTAPTQSTVTDSVVQPTSGQTAVRLDSTSGHHGQVEMKTQTTTSQAGKTVSRETTKMTPQQPTTSQR
ncbi:hypothetical protein [Levilactobacillus suantsaii]|uniref:Uncharacterized protein n=1 Tax=Levilactobacillus suantsaii TaxID=2292255 RepID=A0A4V1LFE8_9LACO|nr:hypothetical protein [Levilactobacillus suantsaii]QMU08752.1 hypothetical protein H3M12_03570 [Levilactobacillus suantsaii]RXI78924.1 hypothetical protein DXH47_05275 [Levilactobacillus suantsaii]